MRRWRNAAWRVASYSRGLRVRIRTATPKWRFPAHLALRNSHEVKRRLNEVYVRHTGKDYETIERTLDRDYFMSAEDARAFGIVDEVITKRHPLDEKI